MSGRALMRFASLTSVVMLSAAAAVSAGTGGGGGHGGGGGGGHGGGGHFGGGFHGGGGGYHGASGGGHSGWRGGHTWRRGYGWGGGYYSRYGWCCGWGWGLGFYLPLLPWYYDTFWWGDIPYYYADGNYYVWDGDVGEYQAVEPPAGLSSVPPQGSSVNPAVSSELFAYPKGGQSEAQQKQDKDECSRWAAEQTGFNPAAPSPDKDAADARESYVRADAACLEARNYSVR